MYPPLINMSPGVNKRFILGGTKSYQHNRSRKRLTGKTVVFDKRLKKLKDRKAVFAIVQRFDRAIVGNFGDVAPFGEGVSEMRIFIGPGYRLYYTICKDTIVFMLCGGDKSTQKKDIKKAVIKLLVANWLLPDLSIFKNMSNWQGTKMSKVKCTMEEITLEGDYGNDVEIFASSVILLLF